MKKLILSLITILAMHYAKAQNTPWSTTGSIGIGTTSPFYPFQVGSNIWNNLGSNYLLAVAGDAVIGNATSGSQPRLYIVEGTHGTGTTIQKFNGYTSISDGQGVVNLNGNIGIGTISPSSQLAIGSNNASNPNTTGADIPYSSLTFQNLSSGNNFNIGRIATIQESGDYLDAGAMAFSTGGAGLHERMRISSSGYVGIGTTSPMGNLDVNFNNGEPKNVFVFSGVTNPTYNPVGGLRFAWYGTNFADIQMVRQGGANDGLGLSFHTSTSNNSTTIERMRITAGGNVIIGNTTQTNASYMLDVWGNVRAKQITVNTTGADFVFAPSYKLNTLPALKEYIDQNHHLPEIASAKEMQKDGLNVGENQVKLLQKVEELTLYLIEKDRQLDDEKDIIGKQQQEIDSQKQKLDTTINQVEAANAQLKIQEEQISRLEKVVIKLTATQINSK